MLSEARIRRLVREMHAICARHLVELGEPSQQLEAMTELQSAARRVVWAWHYTGDDACRRLKDAMAQIEDIVGRPINETHI
jgi:hypothetical protein